MESFVSNNIGDFNNDIAFRGIVTMAYQLLLHWNVAVTLTLQYTSNNGQSVDNG